MSLQLKGDLMNILNQMVPVQLRRSMISINFQPFNKSMTEVIEYMEKLEVLEATNKQSGTKKNDIDDHSIFKFKMYFLFVNLFNF